jgi:ubiquitin-protein ligase E3 B
VKKVSVQFRLEWEEFIDGHKSSMTAKWISDKVLRPFLFFTTRLPWFYQKDDLQIVNSTLCCFSILLSSINLSGTALFLGVFQNSIHTMNKL